MLEDDGRFVSQTQVQVPVMLSPHGNVYPEASVSIQVQRIPLRVPLCSSCQITVNDQPSPNMNESDDRDKIIASTCIIVWCSHCMRIEGRYLIAGKLHPLRRENFVICKSSEPYTICLEGDKRGQICPASIHVLDMAVVAHGRVA